MDEAGLPRPPAELIFADDDISAARRDKVRDDFMAMIAAMENGEFNVLWVWEKERLNRTLTDFDLVTYKAVEHGVKFLVDDKWFDPADDDEWALAGIGAVLGGREVRKIKRRVIAGVKAHASAGKPYGQAGFGFRATYQLTASGVQDRKSRIDVVHEGEAEIIRELAAKIIDGVPYDQLCDDLEARGIRTSRGGTKWTARVLKRTMTRPKLVGDRSHNGVIVAPALSEAILDRQVFIDLMAAIGTSRKPASVGAPKGGRPASHLLVGLMRCAICESRCYAHKNAQKPGTFDYVCGNRKRHVARNTELPDAVVIDHAVTWLMSDEARQLIDASRSKVSAEAARERKSIDERLKAAARMFAAETIDEDSLTEINNELRPRQVELDAILAQHGNAPVYADLVGPEAAELWKGLTLARKRAVIAELFEVRMLPSGKGKRATRDHVKVTPKIAGMRSLTQGGSGTAE